MQRRVKNLKIIVGFTLVELIIVIAIISLLAGIVVVTINPVSIFANTRNSQRANDLSSIQASLSRYFSDASINSSALSLNNIPGYSQLYANATILNQQSTPTYYGVCANGSTGSNLPTIAQSNSYGIGQTGIYNINLYDLVNSGYLPKIPVDPLGTNYQACIDTSNNNNLVIYAPATETTSTKYTVINSIKPTIKVWDSFNRYNASVIGSTDNGKAWSTYLSSTGTSYTSNQLVQNQPGVVENYLDSGIYDGFTEVTLANNVAGNVGVMFRMSDQNNFWYFGCNGDNNYALIKFVGGSESSRTNTGTMKSGNPVNVSLRVEYTGQKITLKLDGKTLLSYTDSSNYNINATQVGLYSNGSNFWSNFITAIK